MAIPKLAQYPSNFQQSLLGISRCGGARCFYFLTNMHFSFLVFNAVWQKLIIMLFDVFLDILSTTENAGLTHGRWISFTHLTFFLSQDTLAFQHCTQNTLKQIASIMPCRMQCS